MMEAGHTKFHPDWHFGLWKVSHNDRNQNHIGIGRGGNWGGGRGRRGKITFPLPPPNNSPGPKFSLDLYMVSNDFKHKIGLT